MTISVNLTKIVCANANPHYPVCNKVVKAVFVSCWKNVQQTMLLCLYRLIVVICVPVCVSESEKVMLNRVTFQKLHEKSYTCIQKITFSIVLIPNFCYYRCYG